MPTGFRTTTAEVTEIPIRDIASRLLILTSQTCRARDAVINLSLEKTTGSNLAASIRKITFYLSFSPLTVSLSRPSPSACRCILISHPSCSFRIPVCYGSEDFVNASMHMYFIASSFGRSLLVVPVLPLPRTRDADIFAG